MICDCAQHSSSWPSVNAFTTSFPPIFLLMTIPSLYSGRPIQSFGIGLRRGTPPSLRNMKMQVSHMNTISRLAYADICALSILQTESTDSAIPRRTVPQRIRSTGYRWTRRCSEHLPLPEAARARFSDYCSANP